MDEFQTYKNIHKKYDELFKKGLSTGKLPMRSTKLGFWGGASVILAYEFLRKIGLEKYDHFIDLGSGDGRVVLLASLFTKATGIEGDPELVKQSEKIRDELGLNASFICEDFMKHNMSPYDFIFIYPDKGFTEEFEEKLAREMKGELHVYNNLYMPNKLQKGTVTWLDQLPITKFRPQ
ncbi:class I SAM-dependent methyltransferase [Nanoarchaeota archaeon]